MAMQNGNFGRLKTLKSFPKYFLSSFRYSQDVINTAPSAL
eukprot:XP_001704565.1 Hypothetical protein GL50803_25917 [Giardia lamblia ATCC 50803]